ncbi:hypothetical protein CDD82_3073 [Ophiocordyceps australis]|uniref:Cytochrome P450 n=1 Tax=Ophiocordyceps australis TaxID=1399860 RepID=A0A2C5ZF04_9HYPO|nr:hypothetical protein CDD82_3073 [Ophiocordyceps australis]
MEILNGIIWETLRLYPPVPCFPQRQTPAKGAMVAGKFVAGGTVIQIPQYVLGRDENLFPRATEFIPERWFSSPHLIKDKTAFMPFAGGPYNCAGQQLAMVNLRVTISQIIMRYEMIFAPDRDDPIAEFEQGLSEYFILQPSPLYLRFSKRRYNGTDKS